MNGYVVCQPSFENAILRLPERRRMSSCKTIFQNNSLAEHFGERTVKVERSRARGHVASNTLTARTVAIPCAAEIVLNRLPSALLT